MSSFSKLSAFPAGYFRASNSWLLRNRKEISKRTAVIQAEIERIGTVTVTYDTQTVNGSVRRTENRTGFSVTPNSSLGKLVRAYITQGGNPNDISPFMHPDTTQIIDFDANGNPITQEQYPYGGVAAPMSASPDEPVPQAGQSGFTAFPGGYVRLNAYLPARQGGRQDPGGVDHDALVSSMHHMRNWAKQDIDERLRRLEWQIIKLCDLREQLIQERDEVLVQAFGGAQSGVGAFDPDRFNPAMQVQNLTQDMYDLIYPKDGDGNAAPRSNNNAYAINWVVEDNGPDLGF